MAKRGFVLLLILFLLIFSAVASGSSIDDEFKKLANYAGEYEAGNIEYVQLLIYTSAIRGAMNEILGATGKEIGGALKQGQIKEILGAPIEETKWVWSEGEEREIKMDNAVPVWKKIVYDGKKIQIRLNAWPSIFSKKNFIEDDENEAGKEKLEELEGKLIYRLNFEIEFKKPEEQLNIQGKIDEIQALAQAFNSNPSSENAEALAKESVNAERTFESYFRQSGGKCEDIMKSIFGAENKRQTQNLLVQEISFCYGDNFEVIARLEMCEDCEWSWINLDFRIEGRGPGFKPLEEKANSISPKNFGGMDNAGFEEEVRRIFEQMKQSCDNKDFNAIISAKTKLWPLNDAWNQKSNNVWEEVDKTFKSQTESMTQEQRQEFDQNYGWIKQEQEKKQKVKELGKANYESRKQFYLNLFSNYDKKEYYFTQIEFQKRLVEEFKEKGEEICDNNQDDNQNGAIDCADDQCGGKTCGKGKNIVQEGNETKEIEVDFYCIEKECKAKEEIQEVARNVSVICQELPPAECPEGSKVFFSRYDNETNCPIETSCLEETDSCNVTEDCRQPACGMAECIENKCEVTELTECRELECSDGEEKICELDGRIVEICTNGFWEKLGECEEEPEMRNETIIGNECLTADDCGSDNVCNNGVCQVIPQVIVPEPVEEAPAETPEEQEETPPGEQIPGGEQTPIEETPAEEAPSEGEQAPASSEPSPEPEQETPSEESPTTSEPATENEPAAENEPEETSPEPAPESSSESQETETTGNIIFGFITTLISKIKPLGAVIVGLDVSEGDGGGESGGSESSSDSSSGADNSGQESDSQPEQDSGESQTPENGDAEGGEAGQAPESQPEEGSGEDHEQTPEEPDTGEEGREEERREEERREDDRQERREDKEKEDERRMEENKERCKNECKRPCIEKCIREECGEELNCVVDDAQKKCEGSCEAGDDCIEKCMKGGDWWKEFETKDEHKEEKGVFQAGGNCRTSQGKTEGFIWFGGWGEPFEQIQQLKTKYYSGGQADWCKYDFENLKKQRQEFENGFNQEFVKWFFEEYLANSAENWEQAVSGIFELYWKDVDNSREMAYRMQCLGLDNLPNINLINVKYETEFGSLEFWEEIKTVKLPGLDKEVQIISPYMKAWVFPSKEFMEYEMKKAMKNHEFPGPSEEKTERKNQNGPTAEEIEMLKQDKKVMDLIRKISEKYGGSLDMAIQFKDYENNETIFNVYARVNENDIFKIEPMLPEEIPAKDVTAEIDFKIIYDMIYKMEKEIRGEMVESPPWDKKFRPIEKIKEIVGGIEMYFKMKKVMNSAKIIPAESEKEIKSLFKKFMSMMMKKGSEEPDKNNGDDKDNGAKEGVWESKELITGEVILEK